jgi:hypothetical protein
MSCMWQCFKHFLSVKIWLRIIYTNFTSAPFHDGPSQKIGIYVGYHSPSIIKYLEYMTGDLFTARYADCIFNRYHFPALGGEFQNNSECQEINWDDKSMISSDPRIQETKLQVQKIINL